MLLTLSIGFGLILTLFFLPVMGLYPAGMVVPGYIALQLNTPATIIAILVIAILISFLVRLISRYGLVYGKRQFALTILLSYLFCSLAPFLQNPHVPLPLVDHVYIGYIIPGLIALSILKQGIIKSMCSLLIVSVLVRLSLILALGGQVP